MLPVDYLSDEEFDCEVLESLDQATNKISLRVPRDLLGRTKQAAERRGVPYQSLMKGADRPGNSARGLTRVTSPVSSSEGQF